MTKAAKAMNLTVCKADGAALAELAKKLPNGRLYATGRGFVPAVGRSLYDKIVEQLQLAGQPVPKDVEQASAEQPAPGLPTSWDDIGVGHLVIAHESAINGWWEAIVLARDGDMLTLKWRDYQQPNVVRHAGSVALLKPTPSQRLTIVTNSSGRSPRPEHLPPPNSPNRGKPWIKPLSGFARSMMSYAATYPTVMP